MLCVPCHALCTTQSAVCLVTPSIPHNQLCALSRPLYHTISCVPCHALYHTISCVPCHALYTTQSAVCLVTPSIRQISYVPCYALYTTQSAVCLVTPSIQHNQICALSRPVYHTICTAKPKLSAVKIITLTPSKNYNLQYRRLGSKCLLLTNSCLNPAVPFRVRFAFRNQLKRHLTCCCKTNSHLTKLELKWEHWNLIIVVILFSYNQYIYLVKNLHLVIWSNVKELWVAVKCAFFNPE